MQQQKSTLFPVFVFPSTINFYLDEPTSFKQVVTLYNPYDIGITYKVLSNRPGNYRVVEPVGQLKSKCCVDVLIRHNGVSHLNDAETGGKCADKFRFDIAEIGQKHTIGCTYVSVNVLTSRGSSCAPAEEQEDHDEFSEPTAVRNTPTSSTSSARGVLQDQTAGVSRQLLVSAAAGCVLALLLPTAAEPAAPETEHGWRIPQLLQLSVQVKLAVAYALGLLTMTLLRVP